MKKYHANFMAKSSLMNIETGVYLPDEEENFICQTLEEAWKMVASGRKCQLVETVLSLDESRHLFVVTHEGKELGVIKIQRE